MNRVILVVRAEAYQYPCKAFRGTAEAQYVFNNHVKHTIVLQKYAHLDRENRHSQLYDHNAIQRRRLYLQPALTH